MRWSVCSVLLFREMPTPTPTVDRPLWAVAALRGLISLFPEKNSLIRV